MRANCIIFVKKLIVMERAKGYLFDLDGVLIDSEGTYTKFWESVDRKYPTGIENFAIAIKGTTLPEILKNFEGEEIKKDILRGIAEFQEQMQFELFDDTLPFLKQARAEGIKMAIVTSSDSAKMARLYEQHPDFKGYFDAVIDASMVTKSKPDPEGYIKGAQALGLHPEECRVFEDSLQGLKAARASGAYVVGLATTYPAERLAGLADVVVGRLEDLF